MRFIFFSKNGHVDQIKNEQFSEEKQRRPSFQDSRELLNMNVMVHRWTSNQKYFEWRSIYELSYRNILCVRSIYDLFGGSRVEEWEIVAFEKDAKTIASTKGIYAYFNTLIKLYDNKEKKSEILLNKYEEICEKIEALE